MGMVLIAMGFGPGGILANDRETTTMEFFAQTPGTYPFWCCHRCGLGHKDMKSEIVVD